MRSFPWDSIITGIGENGLPIFDRAYQAEDLREVYKTFFSNGVFMNEQNAFHVSAASNEMAVIVSPGKCHINGSVGWERSERKLVIQAASAEDRIDSVVLRFNANTDVRNIELYVRTGVAQQVPVRPTLVRNDTVWEIGLCDIYITHGTSTVTQQRITDTRLDSERCGMVTPILEIDTTKFYAQLQAALDAQTAELKEQTDYAVEASQSFLEGTIPNGIITKEKLANNAVTKDKISDGSVSFDKLSNEMRDGISKLFLVKQINGPKNQTYPAQGKLSFLLDVEKIDGYIPVGLVGCGSGHGSIDLGTAWLNGEIVSIEVHNSYSFAVKSEWGVFAMVLYVRVF